jgi:coproporphyrinogen III oxidase-like Fe-S oxidoreductase
MVEGIDLEEWKAQTGRDWFADFSRQTETLRGHGFLELSDGRIRIPGEKLCLANEVFVEFV